MKFSKRSKELKNKVTHFGEPNNIKICTNFYLFKNIKEELNGFLNFFNSPGQFALFIGLKVILK